MKRNSEKEVCDEVDRGGARKGTRRKKVDSELNEKRRPRPKLKQKGAKGAKRTEEQKLT